MSNFSAPRYTVRSDFSVDGVSIFGNQRCKVVVHPGNSGIRFLHHGSWIEAKAASVTDTPRCTVLGSIGMVEHIMSAFAGLGITDADVEVEGPQIPGLDGSSRVWVEQIQSVGLQACGAVMVNGLFQRVYTVCDEAKVKIGAGEGRLKYEYDAGERWPGVQTFTMDAERAYATDVAPARTFAFEHEIAGMKASGMQFGLDESSCLVLGSSGYVNEPRFPDEPGRHKLLDLMGDLYLAEVPLALLDVAAYKSGHKCNVEAANRLASFVTVTREP